MHYFHILLTRISCLTFEQLHHQFWIHQHVFRYHYQLWVAAVLMFQFHLQLCIDLNIDLFGLSNSLSLSLSLSLLPVSKTAPIRADTRSHLNMAYKFLQLLVKFQLTGAQLSEEMNFFASVSCLICTTANRRRPTLGVLFEQE